jgi:hypothetical protein
MANRLMTINLRRYLVNRPRRLRHKKAASYLRDRIAHYSKVDPEKVKISRELSEVLTKHHVKSMHPIRVNVSIDGGVATATPFKVAQPQAVTPTVAKVAEQKKPEEKKPAVNKTQHAKPAKEQAATEPVK